MAPAKLKRHLTTNHSHLTNKGAYYFKQLVESQNRVKLLLKKIAFSETANEFEYYLYR
jgi:hypothetical protein